MTITKRDIDNWNRKVSPSANENYNKANGIYDRATYLKLRRIQEAQWGMLGCQLTMAHVKRYQDYV